MGNSVIFPLFDADGIRLTSLRLGPPSAVTYANWLLEKGRSNVAFQAPRGDAEFDTAVNDFITYVTANLANLGIVAGDMAGVTASKTDWDAKYPDHIAGQSTAEALTQAKNVSRAGMLDDINALLVTI